MYFNIKDKTTDMNPEAVFGFNKFLEEYKAIAAFKVDEDDRKPLILGKNEFKCRFCGRQKPDVTFKKRAHALPELIGNKSLFSHYECDDCNSRFGRELETHFANFMHLNHTMFGVSGKKRNPKFKLTKGSEIVNQDGFIDWQDIPHENLSYDESLRKLTATEKIPAFIPHQVYKALIKMAITIMPAEELQIFEATVQWLNAPLNDQQFSTPHLWLSYGGIGSDDRFPHIGAILLKRKKIPDFELVPMIFRLNYGNFQFDVPIPMFSQGSMIPVKQLPYLPNLFNLRDGYAAMELRLIDFAYKGLVKNHSMTFELIDKDGTGTVETIPAGSQ